MIEIKGIFKCNEIKEVGSKKVLSLSNSDKDQDGNYINTYYQIWLSDKVSKLVDPNLKMKIANKCLVNISGWLKVTKSNDNKFTNLTIFPTKIEEYKKEN